MAIENQGYISNLNLRETINPSLAIANLAGVTIPADLKIIQNNLRNISTISYDTFSNDGFFQFDNLEFVFTDDDKIKVSKNVSIGSTTLNKNSNYFVCNSNGKNKFKISTTSSSVGFTTFDVTEVNKDNFNFIRDDSVSFGNLININDPSENNLNNDSTESNGQPSILGNSIFGTGTQRLKNAIEITQDNVERTNFLIQQKYTKTGDIDTNQILKYEGVLKIFDPVSFNSTTTNLGNDISPGLFVGDIRAFSSDNNPWTEENNGDQTTGISSALKSSSTAISINELFFYDQVQITGIGTAFLVNPETGQPESGISTNPNTFTHKLPIKVDGEIYYLLLKKSVA